MYRVEIIFRYNQNDILPDCLGEVHRVANTDYFEILAATFSEEDFEETYSYLLDASKKRELVSFYFESIKRD